MAAAVRSVGRVRGETSRRPESLPLHKALYTTPGPPLLAHPHKLSVYCGPGEGMDFISPTHGKLSFERMFQDIVHYMQAEPAQKYNLIIGTDSLLGDDTCFVTAIIIHRV